MKSSKKTMILGGVALVIVGAYILVGDSIPGFRLAALWPLFMLIPVISMGAEYIRKDKKDAGIFVPMTVLTLMCVHFLWLNFSSWDSISQTWPLFILAPGLGLLISYYVSKEKRFLFPGSILVLIALLSYVVFVFNVHRPAILGTGILLVGIIFVFVGIRKKSR